MYYIDWCHLFTCLKRHKIIVSCSIWLPTLKHDEQLNNDGNVQLLPSHLLKNQNVHRRGRFKTTRAHRSYVPICCEVVLGGAFFMLLMCFEVLAWDKSPVKWAISSTRQQRQRAFSGSLGTGVNHPDNSTSQHNHFNSHLQCVEWVSRFLTAHQHNEAIQCHSRRFMLEIQDRRQMKNTDNTEPNTNQKSKQRTTQLNKNSLV